MMDTKQAQQMVNSALSLYESKVKAAQANPLDEIREIKIDLSKERTRDNPLQVSFPFKALLVEEATDTESFIRIMPEKRDHGTGSIKMSLKDIYKTELGFSKCFIYWDSQPSKSVVLKFFTTSSIENGSLIQAAQSVLPSLSIGGASSPLDGRTYTIWGKVATSGSLDSYSFAGQENTNSEFLPAEDLLSIGTYQVTNPYFNNHKGLLVPAGYNARLLAAEMDVITANAGTGFSTVRVMGAPVGTNVTDAQTLWNRTDLIGAEFHTNACLEYMKAVGLGKKIPLIPTSDNLYSEQKIIPEGRVVTFAVKQLSTTSHTYYYRLILRLERRVGV